MFSSPVRVFMVRRDGESLSFLSILTAATGRRRPTLGK